MTWLESELRDAFWKYVNTFPDGQRIKNCIQCGTCTGSCPVSLCHGYYPTPDGCPVSSRQAERNPEQSNHLDLCILLFLYSSLSGGYSSHGHTVCTQAPGYGVDIYPDNYPVNFLARQFMSYVYKYGRNYELGLGFQYYLKTNPTKLLGSASFGQSMLNKGRLQIQPKSIKQIKEVRAIIDRAPKSGRLLMKYAYYPGCSLEYTAKPYDESIRAVFSALDAELVEIDDWNCCGATMYMSPRKSLAMR